MTQLLAGGETLGHIAREQRHIVRLLAARHRGQTAARAALETQVLVGVHRKIDSPAQQRRIDLGGEELLALDAGERSIEDADRRASRYRPARP